MGSHLPRLTETEFRQRLLQISPNSSHSLSGTLFRHYSELQRWNPKLSLVGPGTAQEVVERHYGESLAALPFVGPEDRSLLDVGSGAGFPGLVLAAALSSLRVTLVESRERKWVFLTTVSSLCGLSINCLNVRLQTPLSKTLPCGIDLVTCRAVSLSEDLLNTLSRGFPRSRLLFWAGSTSLQLPDGYTVNRELALPGSQRRILEIHLGANH